MEKTQTLSKKEVSALAKVFEDDLDLVLFFLKWIELGQNAQKAYKALHPNVSLASAGVLGHRTLKRVKIENILETYGLGLEDYLTQLRDGLKATKWNDFTGEREADHKTREHYHDKQGRLLGIETTAGIQVNQQFNATGDIGVKFVSEDSETA